MNIAPFSLIDDPWIPVLRADGSTATIRPRDIVDPTLVDIDWGRPDLRIATYELLIGLVTLALAPASDRTWERCLVEPPTGDEIDAALMPFAHYFVLDGDSPRFLQDFEEIDGETLPPDALFMDAPGANTLRNAADIFVKRGRTPILSRAAAAIALYALQAFAPSGGAGHRTSMRGGGPLTTLVMPPHGPNMLWRRVWTNVSLTKPEIGEISDLSRVLPWAAATRKSESGRTTEIGHAQILQAFFGMPRRIRLVFTENIEQHPCALTGAVDARVITGLVMKPHGVNYGAWRHPLTPYYRQKEGGELLAVHPKHSTIGYRQWVGHLYSGPLRSPAEVVTVTKRRGGAKFEVLAAGYVTDNMKTLDYVEADLPLYVVDDEEAQPALEGLANQAVAAAEVAAQALRWALRRAIGAEDSNVSPVETPLRVFWASTERPFRNLLRRAFEMPGGELGDAEARQVARGDWCRTLGNHAVAAFDRALPPDSLWQRNGSEVERIVKARAVLLGALRHGYGKFGAALFAALGLVRPETKRKREASHG